MIAAAALIPAAPFGVEAARRRVGPVVRLDQEDADRDEEQDDPDLEQDHRVVRVSRLLDADDENDRDQRDDGDRRQVDDERDAADVRRRRPGRREILRRRVERAGAGRRDRRECVVRGSVVRRQPGGQVEPEMIEQLAEISRPSDRDADVADGVLDDQVPADDPGDELADRRIRVGVRRAGDRHHRRELGVAQRGESAGDRREDEREDDRRAGAGTRRVADDRRARRREDAGADRGAHAEGGEVPLAERPFEAAVCWRRRPRSRRPTSSRRAGSSDDHRDQTAALASLISIRMP